MDRADLPELHYIASLDNVPSILECGILSKNEVTRRRLQYESVASEEVQARRDSRRVPRGGPGACRQGLGVCSVLE